MTKRLRSLLLGLWVAACGGAATASVPLDYVPADTPYLFANVERPDASALAAWTESNAAMGGNGAEVAAMLRGWLAADAARAAAAEAETEAQAEAEAATAVPRFTPGQRRLLEALALEYDGIGSYQDLQRLGWRPDARYALYGIGLVPAVRSELADTDLFDAFVERLADAHGKGFERLPDSSATLAWTLALPQLELQLLVARQDDQVLLALLPASAEPELHAKLLQRPDRALGAAGLRAFNRKAAYTSDGSGWLDFERLLQRLSGELPDAAPEHAYLQALGWQLPQLDATCRDELRGIARSFPRLGMGVTRFDARGIELRALLETRTDLAAELKALAGSAPSLGAPAGILGYSVALDPQRASDWLMQLAQRFAATPYECPALAELNEAFLQHKDGLPVAMLGGFKGMALALDELQFDGVPGPGTMPRELRGRAAVHMQQPAVLLGYLQLGNPELGKLEVAPDGRSVALADGVPELLQPAALVMSERLLAVANGPDAQDTLEELAGARLPAASPLFSMTFAGRFYELLEQFLPDQALGDGLSAEDLERGRRNMRMMATLLRSFELRLSLGSRGPELYFSMLLNPQQP